MATETFHFTGIAEQQIELTKLLYSVDVLQFSSLLYDPELFIARVFHLFVAFKALNSLQSRRKLSSNVGIKIPNKNRLKL